LISDSFSETIASKVTVDTGELDEQLQLGTSHVVKVLTDQGGTITSSDSFNVHHAGEADNAIEWVTNYYDARYPDSDLNEIIAEDKILTADGEIILRPNLQADDRTSDGVEMSFSMEEVNLLRQIINSKEIIVGTEQNREDGTYSRLYKNELQLKSIHEDIGNVNCVLNMFDNGKSLELSMQDDDRNPLSDILNMSINKPATLNSSVILTNVTSVEYIYLDSEDGDDENDGSVDNPLKTLDVALRKVRMNTFTTLYLKEGTDYIINSSFSLPNLTMLVIRRFDDSDDVDNSTITSATYSTDDNTYCYHIYIPHTSFIHLYTIDIIAPDLIDDKPYKNDTYGSSIFVSSGGSTYFDKCSSDLTGKTNFSLALQTRYKASANITVYSGSYVLGDEYLINNRSYSPLNSFVSTSIDSDKDDYDGVFKYVKRDSDTGIPLNISTNLDLVK